MIQVRQPLCFLGLACVAGTLLVPGVAHAQGLTVSAAVSPFNGVFYHYTYSITNNAPQGYDFPDVTFNVPVDSNPADPPAITNFLAPAGYNLFYDAGLGTVDFAEDSQAFTPGTTVSGFQFDSGLAPAPTTFTALVVDSTSGLSAPDPIQGTTLAPAAVPEASTLTSFGLLLVPGLIFLGLRRRKSVAVS